METASGKHTKSYENGHGNSGFSQLGNGDLAHSFLYVYQRVTIRTEKMMVSKGSHAQATFQLVVNYHELFR
jgi:hypothetical protein